MAPVFEVVRFAAVGAVDPVLAVVDLVIVVLAGVVLAAVVLTAVDLDTEVFATVDLAAVDLAAGGLTDVDLAADLADFFALVALAGDVVVDCAGANTAKAAIRATGMEIAIARKDPV